MKNRISAWLTGLVFIVIINTQYASAYSGDMFSNRVSNLSGELSVVQGALIYDIPLDLPPGTAGLRPQLSLQYNSNSGNGYFGPGWNITGQSMIYRCGSNLAIDNTVRGVRKDPQDNICLDGERLVPIKGNKWQPGSEYRTRVDSFSKIVYDGSKFKVWTKSGEIKEYIKRIDTWYLSKISDRFNNSIRYEYIVNSTFGQEEVFLKKIIYSDIEVVFNYEDRPDSFSKYFVGRKNITKRVKAISIQNGEEILRVYKLAYTNRGVSNISVLSSLTECSGGVCLNPLIFTSRPIDEKFKDPETISSTTGFGKNGGWDLKNNPRMLADVNGDGLADIVGFKNDGVYISYNKGGKNFSPPKRVLTAFGNNRNAGGWQIYEKTTFEKRKISDRRMADMNGDGLMDIVGVKRDGLYISFNRGDGTFDNPMHFLHNEFKSIFKISDFKKNPVYFMDMNHDALTDIIIYSQTKTYIIYNSVSGIDFRNRSEIRSKYSSAQGLISDMNADGLLDLFAIHDEYKYKYGTINRTHIQNAAIAFSSEKEKFNPFWEVMMNGWELLLTADMDGDGLNNLVAFRKDGVYIANGASNPATLAVKAFGSNTGWSSSKHPRMLWDINSDGLTDIVGFGNKGVYAAFNTGKGGFTALKKISSGFGASDGWKLEENPRMFADIDGDGLADIVGFSNSGLTVAFKTPGTNKITSIQDSFGNRIEISYGRLTDPLVYKKGNSARYPMLDVQFPLEVVKSVKTPAPSGNSTTTLYKYEDLKFSAQGIGSLGFGKITVENIESGLKTVTEYDQTPPFTGLIKKIDTYLNDEQLSSTHNLYKSQFVDGIYKVWQKKQTSTTYENGEVLKSVTTDYSDIDEYGNIQITKIETIDNVNNSTFTETVHNSFENDPSDWTLSRLVRSTVTKRANGQTVTKTSSFSYDDRTGILLSETIEPEGNKWVKKIYQYDSRGNRIKEIVAGADIVQRVTTFSYDTKGKFAVKITNPLGHIERRTFDIYGNMTSLTGPNGLTTKWRYDRFGKKIEEIRPDGTKTLYVYSFDSSAPKSYYKVLVKTDGAPMAATYFNRLEKKVRTETVSFDGRKVYKDYYYDAFGNIIKQSNPYFAGTTPRYRYVSFDKYGRPIKIDTPASDGRRAIETIDYHGFTTITTNAKGQTKTVHKNALDQVLYIEQEEGATLSYEYDADGNIIRTEDANGNAIEAAYDIFGNKVYQSDPDLGVWRYSYNSLGELVGQIDAKGQKRTFAYDLLGRKVKESDGSGTTIWTYDINFKGNLYKESKGTFSRLYSYDRYGRLVSKTVKTGTKSFTEKIAYDSYGRVDSKTLPNNFVIKNDYNAHGYLSAVKSPKTQIKDFDPDHFKNLIEKLLIKAAEYESRWKEHSKKAREYYLKADKYRRIAERYKRESAYFSDVASKLERSAMLHEKNAKRFKQLADYYSQVAENYLKKASRSSWWGKWFYKYIAYIYSYVSNRCEAIAKRELRLTTKYYDAKNKSETALKNMEYYLNLAKNTLSKAKKYNEIARNFEQKYYDASQGLKSLSGAALDKEYNYFYKVIEVDAAGHVTSYLSGNGLITKNIYDNAAGTLKRITTMYADSDEYVRDLEFDYDLLDNVTYRVDRKLGVNQLFRYDRLNRLTSALIDNRGKITRLTYAYDALGNMTYKSDVGTYTYDTQHPHRVVQAGKKRFSYDANGNMVNNNGIKISYTSFNKPETIKTNSDTITFFYDADKKRYKKETRSYTTFYLDKSYEEKVYKNRGDIERRYFIYAGGQVVSIYTDTYRNGIWSPSTKYLHYDSLGSVDTITNNLGIIEARYAYKPFGQKLNLDKDGNPTTKTSVTNRGYTGHEHIEETGFIHMNARLYDPVIARFLSADTMIPHIYDSQSFNRYSYVRNNPLKYTDPTGHFGIGSLFKPFQNLMSFVSSHLDVIVATAITLATAGSANAFFLNAFGGNAFAATVATGAYVGAVSNVLMTGSFDGALQGAFYGMLSAGMAYGIGEIFGHGRSFFQSRGDLGAASFKSLAHGVSRALIAKAQNQRAKAAFWSGFVTSGFSVGTKGYGGVTGRTLIMATVGGTVSSITGGKFANGAVSGAFVHLFNDEYERLFYEKRAFGDPVQKAKASEDAANVFGFISAFASNPTIKTLATGGSAICTVNKHFLLLEGGKFEPSDALLDGVMTLMPMPTETQDFIVDFTVSEIYNEMRDR